MKAIKGVAVSIGIVIVALFIYGYIKGGK